MKEDYKERGMRIISKGMQGLTLGKVVRCWEKKKSTLLPMIVNKNY